MADFTYRYQAKDQEETDEFAAGLLFSLIKNVESKTWTTGISDGLNLIYDLENFGKRGRTLLNNMVTKHAPVGGMMNFLNTTGAIGEPDKTLKETITIIDKLKKTYGYDKDLDDALDIFGRPLEREVFSELFPLKASTVKPGDNPGVDLVFDLKMNLRQPDDFIGNYRMSADEHNEMRRMVNEPPFNLVERLNDIAPRLQNVPDEYARQVISQLVNDIRNGAKMKMVAKHQHIKEAYVGAEYNAEMTKATTIRPVEGYIGFLERMQQRTDTRPQIKDDRNRPGMFTK